MPCSYCKRTGCSWETCMERLEEYHGTPADRSETLEEMDQSHWVEHKEGDDEQ